MSSYVHDPNAVLDYRMSWAKWLEEAETISTSTWIVPEGIVQATPAPSNTTTDATIWLSGGTVGQEYRVTNRITTSLGRADDRSITIHVQER